MQVNVAGLRRNIKNLAHNYSDAQVKVREATSNDPWGPSATIMAEVAELTNNVVAFSEIMQMIWKRLNDHGKNWRHVYKALILLEYLIKTGSEKVAQQCKENIFAIQTLREFVYFEEGKDQGTHVREKAKQLVNLLKDDERLKNERVKALKAKERFAQYPSGFGSDGYIDGPATRDMRDMPPGWQEEPAKTVSELEMVRPQTAGEEELQLQLAMAMSREEADQEEAKRRSDDVRLQLALSQSEQDFNNDVVPPRVQKPHIAEPQSHLLDLLDIQLGATNISSPPLGLAAGGLTTSDPWATPARAASQMSDPWTGTASPPVDSWHNTAASRSTPLAHMGAVGGMGGLSMATNGTSNGGEAWGGLRTQSPSVTSGSSTEGWLQTNGNTHNPSNVAGAGDPWLSKTSGGSAGLVAAAPPPSVYPNLDPWLSENAKAAAAAQAASMPLSKPLDPWAPKTLDATANADLWKNIQQAPVKKPSPDMDEFDIITNRTKTGDLLTTYDTTTNASNNNALLLDDLDPLSSSNTYNSTGATAKKPLKDPQSFLGENSGLVNLDNLIKPAVSQNSATNSAAYNPFSDTVIPPKTNLFQQQQPAVPSINQLKQQSFQMTINQDPWAPANNTNAAVSQNKKLLDFADSPPNKTPLKPISLNLSYNRDQQQYNNNFATTNMRHSKSDYDGFNMNRSHVAESVANTNNTTDFMFNLNTSHTLDNIRNVDNFMDSSDLFNHSHSTKTLSYPSLYPRVEIVNNNQMFSKPSPPSSPRPEIASPLMQSFASPYAPLMSVNSQENINFNNNNNSSSSYNINTSLGNVDTTTPTPTPPRSFVTNFNQALSKSLASTPGVTIMPIHSQTNSTNSTNSNLFHYGFYDSNNDSQFNSAQCKLENNNNNNNMPWMKPEAAASNPFLS